MSDLIPGGPSALTTIQEFIEFTEAWLNNRRLSKDTKDAYRRDVQGWLIWCFERDLNPLAARFTHVNEYRRTLEESTDPRTGRLLKPTTVARKLTGMSAWYGFMVKMGLLLGNPVAAADRPKVDRHTSTTLGLTPREVDTLVEAAVAHSTRSGALVTLLADTGVRVQGALDLDVEDLGEDMGYLVADFVAKGGRDHRRALAPSTMTALLTYLSHRAALAGCSATELTGPLFVSSTGRRLDRREVFALIRKLAKVAEIATWNRISPHSLRHSFLTEAEELGVPLTDQQDAAGHMSPETTRRYHRNRRRYENDPTHVIVAAREARRTQA